MAAAGSDTVEDVLRMAYPEGYIDWSGYNGAIAAGVKAATRAIRKGAKPAKPAPIARNTTFSEPPASAVDLFAMMGILLLKSGAYHHVCPETKSISSSEMLLISDAQRLEWVRTGKAWRGVKKVGLPPPPAEIVAHWNALMAAKDERAFCTPARASAAMTWWVHAIALFCIADEAAVDIGFQVREPTAQANHVEQWIRRRLRSSTATVKRGPFTLALDANPDILCVLPKSRTPSVGCTLRSMSHNLSILPGRGLARAHWNISSEPHGSSEPRPFNVIVLPMPFDIQATAFKAFPADVPEWGWFDVEPHWCPRSDPASTPTAPVAPLGFRAFAEFVDDLLNTAAKDCGEVHALVLPEVALSSAVFLALCHHLRGRPGFELLISGLFDAPGPPGGDARQGNFTGMARFETLAGKPDFDLSIREKHHRWRIERSQIETYALGSALDVNRGWWEHIDIRQRSLDVFVIRGTATVTTLICEDLARNDPCQELVRGIGPNFVVALLMDGPQRRDRWPARYATVLADDPGSSVLSVSSFGLIHRTNQTGAFPYSNQIGLFRDDTGKATEIQLPKGAHAVRLTLQPTILTEHTLDGRSDKGDAQSWRLSGVQPVTAAAGDPDILAGNWPKPKP